MFLSRGRFATRIVKHPTIAGVWQGPTKFEIQDNGVFFFLNEKLPNGWNLCVPLNYQGTWYVGQVGDHYRVRVRPDGHSVVRQNGTNEYWGPVIRSSLAIDDREEIKRM